MAANGRTVSDNIAIENRNQLEVATKKEWLIACKVNGGGNSKELLEALGFKIVKQYDDLFFEVTPPLGWTKETQGFWTYIKDQDGKEVASQFFKGASYDRNAFINI